MTATAAVLPYDVVYKVSLAQSYGTGTCISGLNMPAECIGIEEIECSHGTSELPQI